jgi:phospholipid transport system substrate-binding protein
MTFRESLKKMKVAVVLLCSFALLGAVGGNSVLANVQVTEAQDDNNGVVDINALSGPEKAVWGATQTLLAIIEEERESYKTDSSRFYERVTEALRPVVGFKRIAAMVMGSYYKKASKKQRAAFSVLFERSLVETYSGGLIEYDGYQIQVLPGAPVAKDKRKAVVNVSITTSSGTQVPLKYSMYQTRSGKWKVQNVTVAGINVGLLYRQQFARKVADASGDLSIVISQWSSRLDVEVEDGQLKEELTGQKK